MPHVFVVPPEEEQQDNPPWCCFDADEQPEDNGDIPSSPDFHFLDVPHLFEQSEHDVPDLFVRRTSIYQPRPRIAVSKKLEKKQRPEAIKIIESKPSQARQRDAREDPDVVEVVKVKRGREALTDSEENANAKRPKTLKARATKALQSIKNVSKTSHRTHVKQLWTSSESMPGIFKGVQEQIRSQQDKTEDRHPSTPPKKVSLSRGTSRKLSQIFHPVKPSRVESSFTVRASSAASAEAREILSTADPSSLPHIRYKNINSSHNEVTSTFMTDDGLHRPVSPTPPMPPTKKNINKKFSVRELQRLFSFSLSSSGDPSPSPTTTGVLSSSAHSSSKPSTSTSTLPYNNPDVPMEEDTYVDVDFSDFDSTDRKLGSQYHQAFHTYDDGLCTPRRLSDLGCEMKLNSFHFDSLSFDPKDFHISREGDIR
ncbi:hypothetical protein L210DRAFT_3641903 [Boletus edulis BED1]|uniref:Uncharacterized protein n=1 Tax=Boletus edulis BED1 TaxID=1328754 RepID=A0AAD4C425_BOLED|nr:hypothetical protein L210DRAFT_3641903 [Boletus edulis BED1]